MSNDNDTAVEQSPDDDSPLAHIPPELIRDIPEEKRELIIREMILHEQYSGPIAHPRIIAGYERYLPGSADRILTMAEQQQSHRMELENRGQAAAIQRDKRGMYLGSGLSLALMGICLAAILSGYSLAGFGALFTHIITMAGVFLYSRHLTRNELRDKREALEKPSMPPELLDSGSEAET